MVIHNIPPVWNPESRILILGSFPSVKSREDAFFYAHPQNRFWKTVAAVFGQPVPVTVEEKKRFLLNNHVAVWDVIEECEIENSADSSIRSAKGNDIRLILNQSQIQRIFVNGKTASKLYQKLIFPQIRRDAIELPSTSPANAAWTLGRLTEAWKIIKETETSER